MADALMIPTYSLVSSGEPFAANVIALKSLGPSLTEGAADAIAAEWADFVSATLDQEIQVDAGIRFLHPFDDPTDEFIASNPAEAGGSTGDLAPVNCCYQIRLIAGAGRRRRGRIFLPGVDEAKVNDGGFVIGTTPTDISSAFGTFSNDIAANTSFAPGVWSRLDGVVRLVSAIAVSTQVATQRRRMYALA